MIVIGVDVHKHSLRAAAVDESGRLLAERTLAGGEEGLLAWAAALDGRRLWAVEDCRHVSGALERQLVAAGERLVRVPPRLTAPERRAGRRRGKSDAIDALAAARAALREPELDRPRPGEERLRELKLLVVHRDDLVDERRRCQQRLRWHLHQLDPASRSHRARSTGQCSSSGSAVGSPAASRRCRCGSRATWSPAAARSPARSASSSRNSRC